MPPKNEKPGDEMSWYKGTKRYEQLAPFKLLPGAQTSFIHLVMTETMSGSGSVGGVTDARSVAAWAKRCNVEERQMSDAMNDAFDKGLVCAWPEIAKDQPRTLRPQQVGWYLPAPAVWEKIPDLPKPVRTKAPVTPIDQTTEPSSPLQDSEPVQEVRIRCNTLITRKLPEPTEKLGYDNRTGIELNVGIVRKAAGSFVLRIYAADAGRETRSLLQGSGSLQPLETRSLLQGSGSLQPLETSSPLQGSALFDRTLLRAEVDRICTILRTRTPDDELWKKVCQTLKPDTPNAELLAILDDKVKRKYPLDPGLLHKLAAQSNDSAAKNRANHAQAKASSPPVYVDPYLTAFNRWKDEHGLSWTTTQELMALQERYDEEQSQKKRQQSVKA